MDLYAYAGLCRLNIQFPSGARLLYTRPPARFIISCIASLNSSDATVTDATAPLTTSDILLFRSVLAISPPSFKPGDILERNRRTSLRPSRPRLKPTPRYHLYLYLRRPRRKQLSPVPKLKCLLSSCRYRPDRLPGNTRPLTYTFFLVYLSFSHIVNSLLHFFEAKKNRRIFAVGLYCGWCANTRRLLL